MSRIGRMPISIPAGVDVKIEAGNMVTVKGPKGTLTQQLHPNMNIAQEGDVIHVTRPNDEKENLSLIHISEPTARPDPDPDPQHGGGRHRGL